MTWKGLYSTDRLLLFLVNVLLNGLNFLLGSFPKLAEILVNLEKGSGGSLISARKLVFGSNSRLGDLGYDFQQYAFVIECTTLDGGTM